MAGLANYGRTTVQRTGNDFIYGQGTDGDATIAANTTLSRDWYYNNLTINNGVTLTTSGYRIFVKGTLTLNGTISVSGTTTGTIHAGTTSANVGNILGGAGGLSNASAAPSWVLQNVLGVVLDSSPIQDPTNAAVTAVRGGSAGNTGPSGNFVAAYTNSDSWAGKGGSAGNAGNYAPNANIVGAAGGKGYPGNDGSATGANAGTGGAGGTGGNGGALVVVVAKQITGTGTISCVGTNGGAGSAGATGNPGTAGNQGGNAPAYNVNAGQTSNTTIGGCNNHSSPVNVSNCNAHAHGHFYHGHTAHHHAPSHNHHSCCTQHHPSGNCVNHGHCSAHHHIYNTHNHSAHNYCSGNYNSTHASHICNTASHYAGGNGGAGGAAAPAVTGNAGGQGRGGGGGAIIIITDSTPTGLTYTATAGTGSTNGATGSAYVILNQ